MLWCQYYPDLIRGAFTLAAAAIGVSLGGWLALRGYFRQKEYELVKARYLDGAIDLVAAELEQAFEIYTHNVTRCLQIMKAFRDEGESFGLGELPLGFRSLETSLRPIAHHRISDLVGSEVIWGVYQCALAFVNTAKSTITKEMPDVIRMKLEERRVDADPKVIFGRTYKEIEKLDKESERFASLIAVLHAFGRMMETHRFTFKSVRKFRDQREVKALLAGLAKEFENDLRGPMTS